jgi:hypothetical protein
VLGCAFTFPDPTRGLISINMGKMLFVNFTWSESFITKFEDRGVIGLIVQTGVVQEKLQSSELIMSVNRKG